MKEVKVVRNFGNVECTLKVNLENANISDIREEDARSFLERAMMKVAMLNGISLLQ